MTPTPPPPPSDLDRSERRLTTLLLICIGFGAVAQVVLWAIDIPPGEFW